MTQQSVAPLQDFDSSRTLRSVQLSPPLPEPLVGLRGEIRALSMGGDGMLFSPEAAVAGSSRQF